MSHWDHLRVCGAVASFASTRYSQRGSSPRVRSGLVLLGFVSQNLGIISACAERSMVCRPSSPLTRDHLRVCGAVIVNDGRDVTEHGSSPRVRSGRRRIVRHAACRGIISACAERSLDCGMLTAWRRDHLRVCGAVSFGVDATNVNKGSSPRVRSGPVRVAFAHDGRGIISACAERSVVFYWDLVRLDGAECLIRTLCGVVEWRCSRYLEWMLSIYVTRASRLRIWGVLVVAGFRKSSERSIALTRRVAPRMNVFLSIIGLIDDWDTITLWGRRYPLGAYPKVDGIRLINEATKGGAHVFHCFVAAY